jgi:hypothetical protein
VLLNLRFLDVAKFTNLTPLSLPILCKLSFAIAGLKISSLPTVALKSLNRILVFREFIKHDPIFHKSCASHHQFYLLFGA